MDFEDLYKDLDNLSDKKEKVEKCCDNSMNYVHVDGMVTCKICNTSIDNIIDSPEWRYYGSEDSKSSNPTRCGMPVNVLLPKSSVGTSINSKGNTYSKVVLYQRWNSMPYKERSKYKVFIEISNKCEQNKLPQIIIKTAQSLYSIVSKTKISRGNNRKGIIAACVFNACKECNVPRSIKELAEAFNIPPKILTKGCKNYTEITRLNKSNIGRIQSTRSTTLTDFIERFCNNLNFTENNIQEMVELSSICVKYNLIYDNTPPAMGTGCIYLYSKLKGIKISKKDISEVCKISEVTINKCYKKLESSEDFMREVQNKYVLIK
jgi:transcription initiation factor TFIIB